MKLELTSRQEAAYDRVTAQIKEHFGSYHQIALRVYVACGKNITGETFRAWFVERRIPTHIVFTLYELMEGEFDALKLCPWLGEYVELKETVAARKSS